MKDFHVNLGHLFAKPYESSYSILRRCLSVNPGIPLTTIETVIRKLKPQNKYFLDRLRSMQSGTVYKPNKHLKKESYRRQCPKCAQHLYHSEIYALLWLSRCPIHHCNFTEACPKCHSPWPDKNEMGKRDCPGCGRIPLSLLKNHNRTMDYRPIADIYKIISEKERLYDIGCEYKYFMDFIDDGSRWQHEIPITSSLYPAYKLQLNLSFSRAKFKALQINYLPVKHISSSLLPAQIKNKKDILLRSDKNTWEEKLLLPRLREEYKVMHHIIKWIKNHDSGHQLHITNYRDLDTDHFIKGPKICIYCLTLSLWYFHITSKHYGAHYKLTTRDFEFCKENHFPEFLNVNNPILILYNTKQYEMNKKFSNWFYRRGLEVLFINILRNVLDWHRRLEEYQNNRKREVLRFSSVVEIFPEQLCSTTLDDEYFTCFYENEHPLDNFKEKKISGITKKCKKYHQYQNENYDLLVRFNHKLQANKFTFSAFLNLHHEFTYFIQEEIP